MKSDKLLSKQQGIIITINVRWWNAEAAYAINLARGLIIKGYRVWLIVNNKSPVHFKALNYDIPVFTDVELDSYSLIKQISNLRKLLNYIDLYHIKVIHSFKSNGSFLFSFLRYFKPELIHIRTRGEARPPKKHFLNRRSYGKKACDGVIAVGDIVKSWIIDLNAKIDHLETIYYADSAVQFQPDLRRQDHQLFKNLSLDTIAIALVGRTQDIKGHQKALKALAKLNDLNVHLFFLVKDLDEFPNELISLKQFIKTKQLTDKVTITDFLPDLGNVLSMVDFGIIPSLASEVNCRVAVEFFSLGKPIIVFPTGSLPEVVKHHVSGLVCADKTSESLAEAIQILAANCELRTKLAENAILEYQSRFSLSILAEKTLNFYRVCAGQ